MPEPSETAAPPLVFERLAEIAVGATARIELCRVLEGPREGQLIVVKRLHRHVAEDPQFVDMFRDEVWMTAALRHPHVVEVVGWGVDDQGPYLAAEFVRGVSLARLMKTVFETGEEFTERQVVYLGACICDGLAAAHGLRSSGGELLHLVHRDMTPGNVLLGFDGQVKIADFGLAKARMRLTKTMTGLLKGQPHYMAPEQIKSQPLDGRTDIFAFGVVLYELFSGRRPWNASSDLEAMRATLEQAPAPLDEHRPQLDKALVALVERCLQKAPEARFPSAELLRDEFRTWLDVHGYREDNEIALARFVRRNAMRQMRWFDRAIAGHFAKGDGGERDEGGALAAGPGAVSPAGGAKPSVPPTGMNGTDGTPAGTDWGDEGPTLIQPDQPSKDALRGIDDVPPRAASPSGPAARERLVTSPTRPAGVPRPEVGSAGDGGGAAAAPASPDGSGAVAAVEPSPVANEPSVGEATTLRRHGGPSPSAAGPSQTPPPVAGPSHPPPGIVAPPDPSVPPIPPPAAATGAQLAQSGAALGVDHAAAGEVAVEAERLARRATAAAAAARQASSAAAAAAQAAALAGEAVLLATAGQQAEALERIEQARRAAAEGGAAPAAPLASPLPGAGRWLRSPTLQRAHAGLVALLSREGVALAGVVLLALLLVLLFWALLS